MALADECQTISVEAAGRILGLGRSSSYEAVRRGEIPHIKIGRRLVVPLAALNRLLENGSAPTGPNSDG